MSTDADIAFQSKQSKKQASKSDAQKRAALFYEIFDYIYVVKCRRLFSLAWYDDQTYVLANDTGTTPPLPTLCCNGPGCQSEDPEFLKRDPFVEIETIKYIET